MQIAAKWAGPPADTSPPFPFCQYQDAPDTGLRCEGLGSRRSPPLPVPRAPLDREPGYLQHLHPHQLEAPPLKALDHIPNESPLHPIWLHCNQGPLPGPGRPSLRRWGIRCLTLSHLPEPGFPCRRPGVSWASECLPLQNSSGGEKCRVHSQLMPGMALPFRDKQDSGFPVLPACQRGRGSSHAVAGAPMMDTACLRRHLQELGRHSSAHWPPRGPEMPRWKEDTTLGLAFDPPLGSDGQHCLNSQPATQGRTQSPSLLGPRCRNGGEPGTSEVHLPCTRWDKRELGAEEEGGR